MLLKNVVFKLIYIFKIKKLFYKYVKYIKLGTLKKIAQYN